MIISKPLPGAKLNRAHPLARGLVRAWLHNEGGGAIRDICTDSFASPSGGSPIPLWSACGAGFGLQTLGATSSGYSQLHPTKLVADLANSSIVAVVATTDVTLTPGGRTIYCERAAAGNDIWKFMKSDDVAGSTQIAFVHRDDAATLSSIVGTANITSGKPFSVGVTKAGTSIILYVHGQKDGSGTLTGTDTMTNALTCGEAGEAGETQNRFIGTIALIMLWSRTLSPQEMLWLASEPYAMIDPIPTVRYVFMGSLVGTSGLVPVRRMVSVIHTPAW